MRVRELHIENFGIHRDRTLALEPGVQVVDGPNEAGKSTLLSLLRHLVFGFPHSTPYLECSDKGPGGNPFQSGEILLPELVLECLVGRGDKGSAAAPNERNEIGKGLAAAGARFDQGVLPLLQGAFYQPGHPRLAAPGTICVTQ